ncbi:MAG: hypothetical protein L0I60_09690, partial [Enterobacterales bacterium]|nr:hypothetical protein [Enterobacterales bacterium]
NHYKTIADIFICNGYFAFSILIIAVFMAIVFSLFEVKLHGLKENKNLPWCSIFITYDITSDGFNHRSCRF